MPDSDKIAVNVLMDEAAMTDLEAMLEAMRASGLEITGVQRAIGTVTGFIEPSRLSELKTLPKVLQVEPSREVRMRPDIP